MRFTIILLVLLVSCSSTAFDGGGTGEKSKRKFENSGVAEQQPNEPIVSPQFEDEYEGIFADIPSSPGLIINDLKCAMCHLTIDGDVISTSDVNNWSQMHIPMLEEKVNGTWYAAKDWSIGDAAAEDRIKVSGGVKKNYQGPEMPDGNADGIADFPKIDFNALKGTLSGTVNPQIGQSVSGSHDGNLVLIGTSESPIKIDGDIFVSGDLVIKGVYTGTGTIYVDGHIYIPFDVVAKISVFPYPEDREQAIAKGKSHMDGANDALALAANESIFIADLTTSLYDARFIVPQDRNRQALDVDRVYGWYEGGQRGYSELYEPAYDCRTKSQSAPGGFNMVEAYLYAGKTISGIARNGSWAIRGGVIADTMHVLGLAFGIRVAACSSDINPVHGKPNNGNYIDFDFRLKAGLPLLKAVAPYFQNNVSKP